MAKTSAARKAKPEIKPEVVANKDIVFNLFTEDAKRIFEACSCCISNESCRYYLHGVNFENSKDGLRAISTDGYKLALLEFMPCVEEEDNGKKKWVQKGDSLKEHFSVIAPTHFIKRLGMVTQGSLITSVCTITISDGWISYKDKEEGFSAKLIDGTFPDYRRVLPEETIKQPETVAFNPKYVAMIGNAVRKVHGKGATVAFSVKDSTSPAILKSRPDRAKLTYVLMPMRF